jgi:hypothetical protein
MSPEALQSAAALHEGLAREELDRETQIGRLHHLTKRDRRTAGALALAFRAIFSLGIAMMSVARILHWSRTGPALGRQGQKS